MFVAPWAFFTFLLEREGSLWSCGWNEQGQLGLGEREEQREAVPQRVEYNGTGVLSVCLGQRHSLILNDCGEIWGCGSFLPFPEAPPRTFQQIKGLPPIMQIACGALHSVAIDFEGRLWTFSDDTPTPTLVQGLPSLRSVACGNGFTIAEAEEGGIFAFGRNEIGQLGLGFQSVQVQTASRIDISQLPPGPLRGLCAGEEFSLLIDNQGGLWGSGRNTDYQLGMKRANSCTFHRVTGLPEILQASAGSTHALALDFEGRLWGWGYDGNGELVGEEPNLKPAHLIETPSSVSSISAGNRASFVLLEDGQLLCCGYNRNGELGLGDHCDRRALTIHPIRPSQLLKKQGKSAKSSISIRTYSSPC